MFYLQVWLHAAQHLKLLLCYHRTSVELNLMEFYMAVAQALNTDTK